MQTLLLWDVNSAICPSFLNPSVLMASDPEQADTIRSVVIYFIFVYRNRDTHRSNDSANSTGTLVAL